MKTRKINKMMNPDPKEYNYDDCKLKFYRGKYEFGGGTALMAICDTGEPYATISVNFDEVKIPKDHIFLDMNNCKHLCQQMIDDGLLELTGLQRPSGFCIYPAARMTDKLKEILEDF